MEDRTFIPASDRPDLAANVIASTETELRQSSYSGCAEKNKEGKDGKDIEYVAHSDHIAGHPLA
ncbi:hypothetical protein [Nonomuraea sp. NPDC049758]|uniref:hypothetical protein n=1 Tax=Nonomuraea sp. NPDC049758 TaxID=3154360 RepID=UPI003425264F